ncbi:hypothetical protein JL721_1965 [Aureococcus anophagefferens]|nr:hypothetical protein JL721_1965 [Aureococcus anophagefferens]
MSDDAWAWWRSLGAPRYVCAPMVDQSERAFRAVARRHGVGLCYSPMLVASALGDASYRAAYLDAPDARDRPLFVQVGGSGEAFVAAAARVARAAAAAPVGVNLGCPQSCWRRLRRVHGRGRRRRARRRRRRRRETDARDLQDPRGAGGRAAVPDLRRRRAYAARLAAAGASCVAVHARTREAKGRGAADWAVVAAVVAAVDVPVIGNGDVRTRRDADALIAETGCAAVMSAEALLADPRLFGDAAGGDAADACRDSARVPAKRKADGPPSDRQCVAIAENNPLCAGGCGNPAKHACARGACRACCGALGGGADCGHHAPKKKRRRAADPD